MDLPWGFLCLFPQNYQGSCSFFSWLWAWVFLSQLKSRKNTES